MLARNYDNDGNPITFGTPGGSLSLAYDSDNEVKSISYASGSPDSFLYNADGQRVQKIDGPASTVDYVYDGSTIIADTNAAGVIQNYYLPGVCAISASASETLYVANPMGSNISTWGMSSNLMSLNEFGGYGYPSYTNDYSGNGTAFRFGGKVGYVSDDHSNLDMLGRRYYIPALGRFLTQDPSGHSAGLNLYEYCDDSPLAKTDPDGKQGLTSNQQFLQQFNQYIGQPVMPEALMAGVTQAVFEPLRSTLTTKGNASWNSGFQAFYDWLEGTYPRRIEYAYGSVETQSVIHSAIGSTIFQAIKSGRYDGNVSTPRAFFNTLLDPSNGTQAQLGAVNWEAWRSGSYVSVKVWNDISPNSFFLHMGVNSWSPNSFSPMSDVRQVFRWSYSLR